MVQSTKENGMQSAGVPFAWVEVQYPDKVQWDETGFYDMVEQHVAALREQYRGYAENFRISRCIDRMEDMFRDAIRAKGGEAV